jgi:S-adenosylmethionine:tRNA-ribosyltransferase-isomerase (queuine synthetase)
MENDLNFKRVVEMYTKEGVHRRSLELSANEQRPNQNHVFVSIHTKPPWKIRHKTCFPTEDHIPKSTL